MDKQPTPDHSCCRAFSHRTNVVRPNLPSPRFVAELSPLSVGTVTIMGADGYPHIINVAEVLARRFWLCSGWNRHAVPETWSRVHYLFSPDPRCARVTGFR